MENFSKLQVLPVSFLLLLGCAGSEGWNTRKCLSDPSCPFPIVSAHRGLCGDEPENTLAAYRQCENMGVPMVELDPRQTADGHWVIMHDSDVTRTTNGEQLYGTRVGVDELTIEEFEALVIDDQRCSDDPDSNPARCHPPTFEQVIEGTGPGLLIDADFKSGDAAAFGDLVRSLGATDRVLFFDNDADSLRAYMEHAGGGIVMHRAHDAQEVGQIMSALGEELELKWIHIDPAYLADALAKVADTGVRLYLNTWDYNVDTWLYAAEAIDDPEQKAEFERKAFELLDELVRDGAMGLGTDRARQISSYLYPNGLGNQ